MDSIKRPRKLIKYASFNNIQLGTKVKITPRLITLVIVMAVLLGVIITLIGTRKDYIVDIIRASGTRYQMIDDDKISNLYKLVLVNKTFDNQEITLKLTGTDGEIKLVGADHIHVKGNDLVETNFFVVLSEEEIHSPRTKIMIDVLSRGKLIANKETMFLGPPKHKENDND
jgi:polyferredoxin